MIDSALLTVAVWCTGNKRRQYRAEQLCKDYALYRLEPALYAGRLSQRERREFESKLETVLSDKRDSLYFFTSCRACAKHSSAYPLIEAQYDGEKIFEIV